MSFHDIPQDLTDADTVRRYFTQQRNEVLAIHAEIDQCHAVGLDPGASIVAKVQSAWRVFVLGFWLTNAKAKWNFVRRRIAAKFPELANHEIPPFSF
jgi:hypothetical protein